MHQQQQQLAHPQQHHHHSHQQLHHAATRGNHQQQLQLQQGAGPRHVGRSPQAQPDVPQVASQEPAQQPLPPAAYHLGSPKASPGMPSNRFTPTSMAMPTVRGFQPRLAAGSPSHHQAHHHSSQQQQLFVARGAVRMEVDTGMDNGGPAVAMGNAVTYAGHGGNAPASQPAQLPSLGPSRKTSPGSNAPTFFAIGSSASMHGGINSAGLKSPTTPPALSPTGAPLSHIGGVKRNSDGNLTFDAPAPTYHKDHRRVNHINAEHKRRCNIKNGFDTLQQLIPSLQQSGGAAKVSKAAMLHKAADIIKQLKQERQESQSEVESLKAQIESISRDISVCQSQLPDTGAPVVRHKTSKVTDMYKEYVRQKTLQDWKFWVFSLIAEPMAESFSNNVSNASFEDLCRSTLSWGEQSCSLVTLRPSVLGSLRHLSTNTSILSNPAKLPEEAVRAVAKVEPSSSEGHMSHPGSLSHQSSTSSCSSMS